MISHLSSRGESTLCVVKWPVITMVKPLSHQSGVLTAFPQRFKKLQNAEVRARCANASNAVQTRWKRCAIA